MAKSGQTFGKKEKEKNRLKHQQDKREKMEERKANAKKGKSLDEMMAYIDENGNISATPPDPKKVRVPVNVEDIQIGVPKYVPNEEDIIRSGVVTFFNEAKGFGFIKDMKSQESVFVHVNQLTERIKENDKVSFEVEQGPRGLSAINIKKA